MKTIHYIGNNKEILGKLRRHFSERDNDFNLEPYNITELTVVDVLLILEPFKVRTGDYYFIHPIWRAFFMKHPLFSNDIKLIVAGFEEHECPNYLNLRSFPTDFSSVITRAFRLNEDWGIELGKYEDQQIIARLNQFFKGHDPVSLFQKLTYVSNSIKNINYTISGEIARSFEYAITEMLPLGKQQWQEFEIRWAIYQPYFECCPFSEEKREMEALLERIAPIFGAVRPSKSMFLEVDYVQVLEDIHQCLEKMHQYVRPDQRDC